MNIEAYIVPVITGIIGALLGVFGGSWALNRASAAAALAGAVEKIINPLTDRVDKVEAKNAELEKKNTELVTENKKLANCLGVANEEKEKSMERAAGAEMRHLREVGDFKMMLEHAEAEIEKQKEIIDELSMKIERLTRNYSSVLKVNKQQTEKIGTMMQWINEAREIMTKSGDVPPALNLPVSIVADA